MLFETLEDYDKAIAESDNKLNNLEKKYKTNNQKKTEAKEKRIKAIISYLKKKGYPVEINLTTYGYLIQLTLNQKAYKINGYIKDATRNENNEAVERLIQLLTICEQFKEQHPTWTTSSRIDLNNTDIGIYKNTDDNKQEVTIYINFNVQTDEYSLDRYIKQTNTEISYKLNDDISLSVTAQYEDSPLEINHKLTLPTSLETLSQDLEALANCPQLS